MLKNKIHIVNYLLTRRCNLNCSYCALVRDYEGKPERYPDKKHYFENEIDTEFVLESLRRLKMHNPNVFIILYGGEPLLRKDLPQIVNFCNALKINYTIITNNTPEVQPMLQKLIENTEYIQGLTSSVDPIGLDDDISKKSISGMNQLIKLKEHIKDVVAEITVSKNNINKLYDTVKLLSENNISSSVTFIDIAKSKYYDFSNISDSTLMVDQSLEVALVIEKLLQSKYDIHMKEQLLPMLFNSLPADYDCQLENDINNITIDANGSVRLCLRIRGVETPNLSFMDYIDKNGIMNLKLVENISKDKQNYCRCCNWSCVMMSNIISNETNQLTNLLHSDRR